MSDDERFHRPEPPRTRPYRDFANILRSAGPRSDPDRAEAEGCYQDTGAFVADGVRTAYQVVDAYLRQGRRVARRLGLPAYGPLYGPPLPASRMGDLSARWIQASAELLAVGFEFLGALSVGAAGPDQAPEWGGPGGWPEPAPPLRDCPVSVQYEIASSRLAHPSCEFLRGRETVALACHGLRVLEVGVPTIPVELDSDERENRVWVRIRVPTGQPPGHYTAALLHAVSGESVGILSLRLR